MKVSLIRTLFVLVIGLSGCKPQTPPEISLRYDQNQSFDYYETIEAYQKLADHYKEARLKEMGFSDTGKPLHLFMISGSRDFDPASIKRKGKTIVLIMNGIHAGEPVGIDASIQYAMNLLEDRDGAAGVLDNTVLAIIPVYNVDGALNRSPYFRLNQDGPAVKGSRRNALNLDLNRDFVKQDSRVSRAFASLFHYLDPDVFIDTHTTNGVDHQFTMTLIPTLYQKLPPAMGQFFHEQMVATIYERMNSETPWGMCPYVQTIRRGDVRSGLTGFNDHPYFSSGYAALFNTFPFITETLVYKPFPDRVRSTIDFIRMLTEFTAENNEQIRSLRAEAKLHTKQAREFVLDWSLDRSRHELFHFKGYEMEESQSPVTGRTINVFNRDKTWEDTVAFYSYYTPSLIVEAPTAYIIPQAWDEVIRRMELHGVETYLLEQDSVIEVEIIHIESYQASQRPSQGRQLISQVKTRTEVAKRQFYRGDIMIYVNQNSNNYIVHMLEPLAPASFFTWGFFNSTLEDGEWFSLYSIENLAYEMLENDEVLRENFDNMQAADPSFAGDPLAQLQYLYDQLPQTDVVTGADFYPVSRIRHE